MTTDMDLAEWLLEQIAEDERAAREVSASELSGSIVPHAHTALGPRWEAQHGIVAAEGITWDGVAEGFIGTTLWDVRDGRTTSSFAAVHIARWDPERVLAECDAKRRIITLAEEASGLDAQVDSEFRVGQRDEAAEPYVGDVILRALALPYVDRPGYQEAWRV